MKQKFRKFTRVRICNKMPPEMDHFTHNVDAIVNGTYSQQFGGPDINSYSLYLMDGDGVITGYCSWYREDQLTELPDQDREKAEDLIEGYNLDETEN